MRLILTSSSPWNSNYCSEAGDVVYVVTAPFKLIGRIATIEKVIPPGDQYHTVATIEFKALTSSIITFNGHVQKTSNLFSRSGMSWSGSNRVFTGPDGREYKWKMGSTKPELTLNDGSNSLIAKYHRHHAGVFSPSRPASLEIFPPGDQIVDFIVTTFIYIEKLRKDRERARNNGGGGGGGGDGGG